MDSNWFHLNASSTASLAEFMLSIVFYGYFVRLQNKSEDTRLFILFLLSQAIYYAAAVISDTVSFKPLLTNVHWLYRSAQVWLVIFTLWFAYKIAYDAFPRERIIAILAFIAGETGYIYIVGNDSNAILIPNLFYWLWIMLVFLRKARRMKKERDTGKKYKLFRSFVWFSVICLVIHIFANLTRAQSFTHAQPLSNFSIPYNTSLYIIHPLILVATTYSVFIYLNYATEKISFQAKLVGVVLCAVLIILGLVPFILFEIMNSASKEDQLVQSMRLAIFLLIPVVTGMAVFGLPLFFGHGILRPLGNIVSGVQRIHAGDLSGEIYSGSNDEMGQLAIEFNNMTIALRKYSTEMETLVEDRTVKLIELETEQLRAYHEKELLELEAKALRAQMNPHFIFNCMNSIKALIQQHEEDKAIIYLIAFSKLIRTIFQNSDKREITLSDEMETCMLYTQLEGMRFGNKFSYEFCVDETLDLKSVMVPALIIQPFIENAIWHGIMSKEGRGNLQITLKKENDVVRCIVDDDGVGREMSRRNQSESNITRHQSKGMRLTQTRLDLDNLLNNRDASVKIIDKKNDGGHSLGTTVVLEFNLN